jgi:hypothetical protein
MKAHRLVPAGRCGFNERESPKVLAREVFDASRVQIETEDSFRLGLRSRWRDPRGHKLLRVVTNFENVAAAPRPNLEGGPPSTAARFGE